MLEVNAAAGGDRRFVLIEQGRPSRRDTYARTLTTVRLRRAINGERVDKDGRVAVAAEPLGGGFRFTRLTQRVDADAVLALEREEMIDLLLTSHWDHEDRAAAYLRRLPASTDRHLFAVDARGRGYFLVWDGPEQESRLNRQAFHELTEEARQHGLKPPFHVYARLCTYSGPNVEFYQIPDRILDKLGFNTTSEPFSVEPGAGGDEENGEQEDAA